MLSFYLIQLGMYLYYSKSKYFPNFLFQPRLANLEWLGCFLLCAGTARNVATNDWAGGLILSLAACALAMILVQIFAVLGRLYFYGFIVVVHAFLFVELISYAS